MTDVPPAMPPEVSAPAAEVRPAEAEVFARATINMDRAAFDRLHRIAPGGDIAKLLAHSLRLYEEMLAQARHGYTRLELVKPNDPDARRVYPGDFRYIDGA